MTEVQKVLSQVYELIMERRREVESGEINRHDQYIDGLEYALAVIADAIEAQ